MIYTGKSSMHIAINVFSRNIKRKVCFEKKTHLHHRFVAVDDEGNTIEFPNSSPGKQMEQYIKLMDLRKKKQNGNRSM